MVECLVERAGSNRNAASLIFPRPVNSLSPGDREPSSDPFPQSYCRLSQRWWYVRRCCCRCYYMLSYPYLYICGCLRFECARQNAFLSLRTIRRSQVTCVYSFHGNITTHFMNLLLHSKYQNALRKLHYLFPYILCLMVFYNFFYFL